MSHFHTALARGRSRRRTLATSALLLLTVLAALPVAGIPAAAASKSERRTDDFVVASFNVLGHSHTKGPQGRRGFDGSAARMTRAVQVLQRTDADVVGFQELQRPQFQRFRAKTNGRWAIYPGSRTDTENSIAWRTSQFRLVRGWNVAIPYFNGNLRQMPVVELKSRDSGQRMFVMNVHNPADTRGNAAKWRRIAVAKERAQVTRLTKRLQAPVLLTGDMNDRAAFFCPMTSNGVMHTVYGGSHRNGRCNAPESGIDWILGNKYVTFQSHRVDRSRLVNETTDHPVVSAHVRVASR